MNACDVVGCDLPLCGRGLCRPHYQKWKRTGQPVPLRKPYEPKRPPADRFWEKVEKTDTCWLWRGRLIKGYGRFYLDGGSRLAHRVSYEMHVGPIPEGLTLDHLCRTPACVRPDHLEPVTAAVNALRGTGPTAVHAAKTHCIRGHEFTPENTKVYIDKRGRRGRRCIACAKEQAQVRWQRETERRRLGLSSPPAPDFGPCSVEGCEDPVRVKKRMLCLKHYTRWHRYGDTSVVKSRWDERPTDLAS